jgi:hypothetical protein
VTRRNPAARLVVTGCLATRDAARVRAAAPAALVVGNAAKAGLPALFGCASVRGRGGRVGPQPSVPEGAGRLQHGLRLLHHPVDPARPLVGAFS